MPIYCYKCPECGKGYEVVRSMKDVESVPLCDCKLEDVGYVTETERDYAMERPNALGTEKGETFWSQSLAINPEQADEHRRLFPNVRIGPQGLLGFDSVSERSKYCEATGFEKQPGKHKRRHTKVQPTPAKSGQLE